MSVSEVTSLRHPPEKVVAFVRRLIDGYQSHAGPERRSTPRHQIGLPVTVQPLDSSFHPIGEAFIAHTKDVSGGGVGLLHGEFVTAHFLQIEFTTSDHEQMALLARVKHCTPHGQAYHIGARFVVDWNSTRKEGMS
jgi:hypothetical protein